MKLTLWRNGQRLLRRLFELLDKARSEANLDLDFLVTQAN